MRSITFLTVFAIGGLHAASPLGDKQIEQLIATIKPSEGEDPFESIPWQTNLWEARTLAAKEGKPLLLWEMDGHPLGCG